jgi:hypothetical protein
MREATSVVYAVNIPHLWTASKNVVSSITRMSLATIEVTEIVDGNTGNSKRDNGINKMAVRYVGVELASIETPTDPHKSLNGSEELILQGITPPAETAVRHLMSPETSVEMTAVAAANSLGYEDKYMGVAGREGVIVKHKCGAGRK